MIRFRVIYQSEPRRQRRYIALAATIAFLLLPAGCQQKMADQPSYKPLQPCTFFDDGKSARHPVEGTIARGHLRIDKAFYTGRSQRPHEANRAESAEFPAPEVTAGGFAEDSDFVDEFPIPINQAVILHGSHRYMIYCVVCHDPLGTGRGKIVERGYTQPPSFHIERLRDAPVGRLFAVVSLGYGSMPSYQGQIPPEDRWAIVAYVRALQMSRHFPEEQATAEMIAALKELSKDASVDETPEGDQTEKLP